MNVLKDILFLYGRLYVGPKTSKILQTVGTTTFYELLNNPTPQLQKLVKIRIYECVKSIFVDSNFFLYLWTI